jgi:hypothetical protein
MKLSVEIYDQIIAGVKSDSQGGRDKRREPRVGLAAEADFVTVDETGGRVAGVLRVRDISASGIGLLFPRQMNPNQRFVLQIYSRQGEAVWLVCLTTYCRRKDGGTFSVGAKISQVMRAAEIAKVEYAQSRKAAVPMPAHKAEDIERISKAILS